MEKTIQVTKDALAPLFGAFDENIRLAEQIFGVRVSLASEGLVTVRGDESGTSLCIILIEQLAALLANGETVDKLTVRRAADMVSAGQAEEVTAIGREPVVITARGKAIKCKTLGQSRYVKALKAHPIVFGVGPAGTGKTYLAVASAVAAFKRNETERIILTRPAIEAGERLGFLPGDLQQKVDPYLRPLYDALSEMLGVEHYTKLIERGVIEIAPLAYMRGRTLQNAYIILDEAQNTSPEQMKMFLTRMGDHSRIVVTGDPSQVDLPFGQMSGLAHAVGVLENVEGIAVCWLTGKDIVRHELVERIVRAYDCPIQETPDRRVKEVRGRGSKETPDR